MVKQVRVSVCACVRVSTSLSYLSVLWFPGNPFLSRWFCLQHVGCACRVGTLLESIRVRPIRPWPSAISGPTRTSPPLRVMRWLPVTSPVPRQLRLRQALGPTVARRRFRARSIRCVFYARGLREFRRAFALHVGGVLPLCRWYLSCVCVRFFVRCTLAPRALRPNRRFNFCGASFLQALRDRLRLVSEAASAEASSHAHTRSRLDAAAARAAAAEAALRELQARGRGGDAASAAPGDAAAAARVGALERALAAARDAGASCTRVCAVAHGVPSGAHGLASRAAV